MKSFREFVRDRLVDKLLDDVKERRIFNEADLQYRAACHLDKEYYPNLYLTNQPLVPIGITRGTSSARPDIVLYDERCGPRAAFELKCFIKNSNPVASQVVASVWHDVEKLRKFRARYRESQNAFALVLLDVDLESYKDIQRKFSSSNREPWMNHYFFISVINVLCDESGRKRNWYNQWHEEMNQWREYFADE